MCRSFDWRGYRLLTARTHGHGETLFFGLMSTLLWTRVKKCTRWIRALKPGDLKELFQDVEQGRIRVILDPSCPFPFTEEGVRSAMAPQKSTHAHGKVVINTADE